ncbi:MAG: gliding-motility protein MglA [Deltaproteobacteria bacterium CG11_big_fil_rev_8_21_14_0_20_47_16]|nr:MAG: gliding-motility protein MglA [Deltaproteobacteria bacterium CG11_big_fil_rev_8_21_14_0_20_47_16]
MSFINEQTKEVNFKIVYFGPARSGKSTSLRQIYTAARGNAKSKTKSPEPLSLTSESDSTLYFDFIPLSLGEVKGYKIRLHIYTVPGEVAYEANRKIISKGVDGVVFVADSQLEKLDHNLQSLNDLGRILAQEGVELQEIPHVIQYNKRDLKTAVPTEQLQSILNKHDAPWFETTATNGDGVMDALRAIGAQVLAKND